MQNYVFMQAANYWCTWTMQAASARRCREEGIVRFPGDQGLAGARDSLDEASLFREDGGWARAFYPESRDGMNFLLDDGWDVGHGLDPARDGSISAFGSMVLCGERFPSFPGTPPERLKKLVRAVRDLGWSGLGLWVAPQTPGETRQNHATPAAAEEDLRRKIGWCAEAGVSYLKVDWGVRCGDVAYRRRMSEIARELAPDLLVEHCRALGVPFNGVRAAAGGIEPGSGRWEGDESFEKDVRPYAEAVLAFCDVFRIYDLARPLATVQAIERAQTLLRLAERTGGRAYVNVEDNPVLGAALGATFAPARPAPENDVARQPSRAGEVTRAVAWQRIAPPFRADAAHPTRRTDATLTNVWSFLPSDTWYRGAHGRTIPQTAPAVVVRGLDVFPEVRDAGEGVPFVTALRHPNGALAVAALPRTDAGRVHRIPAAHVRLDADAAGVPVAAFGRFKTLELRTSRRPASVLVRDLAGATDRDIFAACTVEPRDGSFAVTLPGDRLEAIGREALDDDSSPGALIRL